MNTMIYNYAVLFFLIPVLLITAFMLKKWLPLRFKGNEHIKLINQISIGSKERVALLEFNDARILIGITAHNISTLYVQNHDEHEN
ncbi:flagellar biosynthetic protein FliO [Legionella nagasakiensis]|uniref:flagellar biosynthetic protein FliO n=1 Tax=Legionella nagasakiensis TaxID=535290 RepID=UPI001055EE6B|nr:flagellar biosynthetic protein FliO [Legionella nagasakiensis]